MTFTFRKCFNSLIFYYLFTLKLVSGHYCEWNLCRADQYCCGDNTCCDYVYSLWNFWIGIVLAVILLSACGGLFRYYFRQLNSNNVRPPYTSLPSEISNENPLYKITTGSPKSHTHLDL